MKNIDERNHGGKVRFRTKRKVRRPQAGGILPQVRVRKKFRVFSVRAGMDLPFLFLVLTLLVIGLVMMFSASYASAAYYYNDSYFFIKKQLIFAVIGVVVMIALSYFDYHHLHKLAVPDSSDFACASWLVAGHACGKTASTAGFTLGALGQFQPSEVAKFAIVLMFAHLISLNFSRMSTFRYGVLPYLLILAANLLPAL